ncbi:hypothetical protein [Protofrankia coriariae]|uniref:hypothetical protein n=1 Tax=Protofrankia coriariae TaxID=1562887 RepID=UPI001F3FE7CB|nr:hypothetical protein [Protofrankia coriariae]
MAGTDAVAADTGGAAGATSSVDAGGTASGQAISMKTSPAAARTRLGTRDVCALRVSR